MSTFTDWIGAVLALTVVAGCGSSGDAGQASPPDATVDAFAPDSGIPDAADETEVDAGDPCLGCHGGDGAADSLSGAHAAHLGQSTWHAEVRCQHCHVVPDSVDSPGHLDDALPADVTFSGVAIAGLSATTYDPETGTCAVFCHGAAIGEVGVSPPWTSSETLECGDCHGMPPAAPHPEGEVCVHCHIDLIDVDNTFVRPLYHIDSIIQAPHGAHLVHLGGRGGPSLECTHCHVGDEYHGLLKDGHDINSTTVCDECHTPGEVGAEAWLAYPGL